MGALREAFEAYDKKIEFLTERVIDLEMELTVFKGKYEDLCAILRKKANEDRNNDLTNYAIKGKKGPWN